jgi:N utilization substance protein B
VGVRRQARELALQALYSLDLNQSQLAETLSAFWDNFNPSLDVRTFAEELINGYLAHHLTIDAQIEEKSKNWTIYRMAKVDLNILRLAVYELLYRSDIPKSVTINEAIEIAKKFGAEESPAFVNGILDEFASRLPEKD